MSIPLEKVQHLLVTPDYPPRRTEGLDFERCVELHNAILEYGWLSSGRSAEEFQLQCTPVYERVAEAIDDKCSAPLKAFLQGARDVPSQTNDFNIFYNVSRLVCAFGCHGYYTADENRILTLYSVSEGLYGKPDGLVYDQHANKAIMHFDITDDLEELHPWQPLESILSVWIKMIQRGKDLALADNVCKASYDDSDWQQDTDGIWQEVIGPQRDPSTGAIRIGQAPPWTIVPWTQQDLTESLELWETAVDMIEQKMSLPPQAHERGLVNSASLGALPIPEGFATEFMLQARKPRFKFLAPGLRLPNTDEFAKQPFMSTLVADEEVSINVTPPILLFRGDTNVSTDSLSPLSFGYPYEGTEPAECPSGL